MVDTLMALGAVANPYRGRYRFSRPRRRNPAPKGVSQRAWRRALLGIVPSARHTISKKTGRPTLRATAGKAAKRGKAAATRATKVIKRLPVFKIKRPAQKATGGAKVTAKTGKAGKSKPKARPKSARPTVKGSGRPTAVAKAATRAAAAKKAAATRKRNQAARSAAAKKAARTRAKNRRTSMAKAKSKAKAKAKTARATKTKARTTRKTGKKRASPRVTRKVRGYRRRRAAIAASKRAFRRAAKNLGVRYRRSARGRKTRAAYRKRQASRWLSTARRHRLPNPFRGLGGDVLNTASRALVIGGGFFGGRILSNYVRKIPVGFLQSGPAAPTLTAATVFALAYVAVPRTGMIGRHRDDLLIGLGVNVLDQALRWLLPDGSVLKQAATTADGLGDIYAAAAGAWDYAPYRSMPVAGAYYETGAGDFQEAAAGSYYETGEPVEGVGSYYEAAGALGGPANATALPPAAAAPGVSQWGGPNGAREEQPVGRHLGRDRPGGIFSSNVFGL